MITLYLLVCSYIFVPEFGGYRYQGEYESVYGNTFTYYFEDSCPQTIRIYK